MAYKDKEKAKAYQREWQRKNRAENPKYRTYYRDYERKRRLDPAHRERMRAYAKHVRIYNPRANMLSEAKKRAKARGLPINITIDDIVIPDVCPILGIHLAIGEGHGRDGSPSLDRIHPQLGYVRGNIQVISNRANRIKNDATLDELEKLVAHMRKLQADA